MKQIPSIKIEMIHKISKEHPELANYEIAAKAGVSTTSVNTHRNTKRIFLPIECSSESCNKIFTPDNKANLYCSYYCRDSTYKRKTPIKIIKKNMTKEEKKEQIMIRRTKELKKVWETIPEVGTKMPKCTVVVKNKKGMI